MKLIFIFLVPKFFQALGDFPYIRSWASQGFETRNSSELNFMDCNSDLFRQHAVNCDKIHENLSLALDIEIKNQNEKNKHIQRSNDKLKTKLQSFRVET